jgi:ABC-type multidrug transport system fused ATPase/permease subunit
MSRWTDFKGAYGEARVGEQKRFYANRSEEFERAGNQAAILTIILLMLTSAISALQGLDWLDQWPKVRPWVAFAGLAVPAVSTALAAYCALYAFDRHVKLYRDAQAALRRSDLFEPPLSAGSDLAADAAACARYVQEVEQIFQLEQGQWGQVISEIKPPEIPNANGKGGATEETAGKPPKKQK